MVCSHWERLGVHTEGLCVIWFHQLTHSTRCRHLALKPGGRFRPVSFETIETTQVLRLGSSHEVRISCGMKFAL